MKTIKKLDLESKYSQKIQALFELGREPLVNMNKKPDYEKFGFTKEDIPELLELAMDMDYNEFYDDKEYEKEVDRFFYATVYAVEILGRLQAVEAIEPFLEKLYDDEDNEFFSESMPAFFGAIGKEGIEPLKEHIQSRDEVNLILFEVFKNIVKADPTTEEPVSSLLMDYINTTKSDATHIAFAVLALIDCTGVKYIEFIREIFKTKDVDFSIGGDIEDIEIRLGIRTKRDTPSLGGFWSFDEDINTSVPEIVKTKIGRNDPCPCGSGKKYKKCCLNK